MKYKLNKRRILLILLIIALALPIGVTLSRYVGKFIYYHIVSANNFYFNSDKLTEDNALYEINNWSGVGDILIQFELNNHKNNILSSDSDISYSVTIDCDSRVSCSLNQANTGVITTTEKTDRMEITVTPLSAFSSGDSFQVHVTASSTSPYEKTIQATYSISVAQSGYSYEITDEAGSPYLNFSITNAVDLYTCRSDYGTYVEGNQISVDTYLGLDTETKSHFSSITVTLTFNPADVVLDTTSEVMKKATLGTTTYNGVDYINTLTFDCDPTSSTYIRFYKNDVSRDYTYPLGSEPLVINISAIV